MKESTSTQLRVVYSKDLDLLLTWVNSLPYKIEIKGNPLLNKGKFHLFYVIPDGVKEIIGGDLDA